MSTHRHRIEVAYSNIQNRSGGLEQIKGSTSDRDQPAPVHCYVKRNHYKSSAMNFVLFPVKVPCLKRETKRPPHSQCVNCISVTSNTAVA